MFHQMLGSRGERVSGEEELCELRRQTEPRTGFSNAPVPTRIPRPALVNRFYCVNYVSPSTGSHHGMPCHPPFSLTTLQYAWIVAGIPKPRFSNIHTRQTVICNPILTLSQQAEKR